MLPAETGGAGKEDEARRGGGDTEDERRTEAEGETEI